MIEILERQNIFLARLPLLLPGIDSRGGNRGNPHAVADEQDDVPGPLFARRHWGGGGLRRIPCDCRGAATKGQRGGAGRETERTEHHAVSPE